MCFLFSVMLFFKKKKKKKKKVACNFYFRPERAGKGYKISCALLGLSCTQE